MQQLAGVAPAIQSDYNNAIASHNGMVNAAANSLRAVNPSGDVAALLKAVGAPTSQGAEIASNLNNTFNGGAAVGQYVNGASPLGALQSQGEAATTLARLQPGFTALAGRQSLASALAQQSDARAKIAEQMPGLESDWLKTFQTNQNAKQQLALEAQAAGLKQQNTTFDQNLSLTKLKQTQDKYISDYNLRVKEFNSKQTTDAQKAAMPNASLSRVNGYLVDSAGQPILDSNGKRQILPGFNTNAQGRVVKAGSKTTAANQFPNLTKKQVSDLRAGSYKALNGFTVRVKQIDPKTGKTVLVDRHYPPLSYSQAINQAVSGGVSRRDAIRMLNRFYAPGQRGRPGKKVDTSLTDNPGPGPQPGRG